MINVGIMKYRELNQILNELAEYDKAVIARATFFISVSIAGKDILSAALLGNRQWHVRAVEGLILIPTKETQ